MKLLKPEGLPVHLPRSLSLMAYLCLSFPFPSALDSLSLCSCHCFCPSVHPLALVPCGVFTIIVLIVLCNLTICCTSKSIGHCPACCPSLCLSHYLLYLQIQVRSSVVHSCFLLPCPFPMSVLVPLFQAYYSCPCSLSLCFCHCPYPSVPVSQFLSLTHCPFPSVPFLISVHICLYLSLSPVLVACVSVSVPIQLPLSLWPCSFLSATVTVPLSLSICPCLCTILFFWCHSFSVPVAVPLSRDTFKCTS